MNADNSQDKPCGDFKAVSSTRQRIVEIRLGGSAIRTTADHPFYVEGRDWVSAAELSGAVNAGEAVGVSSPNPEEQLNTEQPRPAGPVLGFVAGTPILTPEGSKPIEQLQPGDVILTQPNDGQDHHEPEGREDDRASDEARWWEWN